MTTWKDKAKDALSKAGDVAGTAGQKAFEAGKAGAEKAGELAKSGAGKAGEVAKAGAESGSELAKAGASKGAALASKVSLEALEKGRDIYSAWKRDEDAEADKLQREQTTLADLSREEQDHYLGALLTLLVPFDPPDQEQLRRVYLILTMMELEDDRRRLFLDQLLHLKEAPEASRAQSDDEIIRLSLAKDLLALSTLSPSDELKSRGERLLGTLNLSTEQIDVLSQWTNWENKILEKIGRSDLTVDSKDLPVEAMKKASAVGVPLTALYLSGSVIGFSAVGLTSGLATIGGAAGLTALGLNPMTAGIAALILGGVAVKKILDATLPTTKSDQDKKLQAGLQVMEARRNRYLALLGRDTVYFYRKQTSHSVADQGAKYSPTVNAMGSLLETEADVTLGNGRTGSTDEIG